MWELYLWHLRAIFCYTPHTCSSYVSSCILHAYLIKKPSVEVLPGSSYNPKLHHIPPPSFFLCHSQITDSWAEIIIEPDDAQYSTRPQDAVLMVSQQRLCLSHCLLCIYISFLKTWRHAFWHAQTLFPTSCYGWHNWSHPGGQNFSSLEFVLSWFYFIVTDRQRDKLNRPLLSRGTGDNESLKKVFAKSFFFRICPSMTEFVALGWRMSYGL